MGVSPDAYRGLEVINVNPLVRRVNKQSAAGRVFPAAPCVLFSERVINSALITRIKSIREIHARAVVIGHAVESVVCVVVGHEVV